jgi:hypothetical protein
VTINTTDTKTLDMVRSLEKVRVERIVSRGPTIRRRPVTEGQPRDRGVLLPRGSVSRAFSLPGSRPTPRHFLYGEKKEHSLDALVIPGVSS